MGETPHGYPLIARTDSQRMMRTMKTNPTSRTEEPAGAPPRCGPHPPHRLDLLNEGLVKQIAPQTPLPCRADRHKIVEQAEVVLSEARAVAAQVDRCLEIPVSANRVPGLF